MGLNYRRPTGLGEIEISLKGCTQNLTRTRTQGKSSNLIDAWARPSYESWRVSGRVGVGVGGWKGGVGLGLRVAAVHSKGTDTSGRHTSEHSVL